MTRGIAPVVAIVKCKTGQTVRLRSGSLILMGLLWWLCLIALSACDLQPWNDPYPEQDARANALYSSFSLRPKHLDPAKAYSSNEYTIIAQIYEPPLQYHYLKRPYTLIPATTTDIPEPVYYDAKGRRLKADAPDGRIAYSVYDIRIRKGIRYQPHPALARDDQDKPIYEGLDRAALDRMGIHTLYDFPDTGSREVTAEDYVYEIKRLANPEVLSPIGGLMGEYIIGLSDLGKRLREAQKDGKTTQGATQGFIDLRDFPLEGAQVVDRYTYRLKVKGKYPQMRYWLAMPFFAPIPYEADRFYHQAGMADRNLTMDWYPIGSGPFMLAENDPNRRMTLIRNPNFHDERYPSSGEPGDAQAGLLKDAGKPLPLLDRVVFTLEKETIPYWNKFLQGYYDSSGIGSDSFDQAIRFGSSGEVGLTPALMDKGIRLNTAIQTTIFYMGFNMMDANIGGYSEDRRRLRQAISIAMDYEEYISIFANGRGVAAQGPIPPGIFGDRTGQAGVNPYVYDWVDGRPRRKSLETARRLLREAGYEHGIDTRTGKPLVLHLDITASGPDDKAMLEWFRKQLQKLDIQLVIRNTDYNRFQEKMRTGNAQIFMWGWNADYPDPENFLFLLYGPNGKVKHHGENAANYDSKEFNVLFDQVKTMSNGQERQRLIDKMVSIAREDAPWIWGMHSKSFGLHHAWHHNSKPNLMANNTLKYIRVDPDLRAQLRADWNQPILWPLFALFALLVPFLLPALIEHRRREYRGGLAPREEG